MSSLGLLVILSGLGAQTATASAAEAIAFDAGPPAPVWTLADRERDKLFYYPDMPIGVVRTQGNPPYLFFAPGTGQNQIAQPNGVYVSRGSLGRFAPLKRGPNGPAPAMKSGRSQPAPDGDYDRDYAGGGPTYILGAPDFRLTGVLDFTPGGRSHLLVQFYHGEFHPAAPKGIPFYGVSALAVSQDGGVSFAKIGEIITPHATLPDVAATGLSVTADGALVEADADGFPVADRGADPNQTYVYCLFSDRAKPKAPSGFSLARVSKSDFVAALLQHRAPVFRKYYRPPNANAVSAPGSRRGFFTEPGVGGASTFVVSEPPNYIATPQVHFDGAMHKFVLVYPENQKSVWIRYADNLFDWSAPQLLYRASGPIAKVLYASAVGQDRDPDVLGQRFYVYFVTGEVPPGHSVWSGPNGALVRQEVSVRRVPSDAR